MCFNIGVIVGPIIGGSLADPINSYPHLFGPGSFFGGKQGVWWMERWPFALPNILNGIFTFAAFLAILFGLDEVSICAHFLDASKSNVTPRHMRVHGTEATGAARSEEHSPDSSLEVGFQDIIAG
jgi:MFS family permease